MVTLDYVPGEQFPTYLARALVLSRRSGEPVCCLFDGLVVIVTPTMTNDEAHDAWVQAKRATRAE